MTISRYKLDFQTELQIFNQWLLNYGKAISERELRAFKQQKRNCKKQHNHNQEQVAKRSQQTSSLLKPFVEYLINRKSQSAKLAIEFNTRTITMINHIDCFLKKELNLSDAAIRNLQLLKTKLATSLAWIRNSFSIPVIINSGKAHPDRVEYDFENLRRNGNFDIRHQQRRERFEKNRKQTNYN